MKLSCAAPGHPKSLVHKLPPLSLPLSFLLFLSKHTDAHTYTPLMIDAEKEHHPALDPERKIPQAVDMKRHTCQTVDTEDGLRATKIDVPAQAIERSSSLFEDLPNEMHYQMMESLSAQDLLRLSQVSDLMRIRVEEHFNILVQTTTRQETLRLQHSMQTSSRAIYTAMSLLAALRVWCEHWGRPHTALYHEASWHFGYDFDRDHTYPEGVCIPFAWRRQFWGRLAEFLLCMSDLVNSGHAECELGNCICGHKPGRYTDWIAEGAHAEFHDFEYCGAQFLQEVLGSMWNLSLHFCHYKIISQNTWLEMVRDVRARPIERTGVSRITAQATRRKELWEAVEKGMNFEPGRMGRSDFEYFQTSILRLPAPLPGFYYVPTPSHCYKKEDGEENTQLSVEGILSTQAAKLAWKICNIRNDETLTDSFKALLRAALLEVIDLSDITSFSTVDCYGETSWINCTERYGEVSHHLRLSRRKEADLRWAEGWP